MKITTTETLLWDKLPEQTSSFIKLLEEEAISSSNSLIVDEQTELYSAYKNLVDEFYNISDVRIKGFEVRGGTVFFILQFDTVFRYKDKVRSFVWDGYHINLEGGQ